MKTLIAGALAGLAVGAGVVVAPPAFAATSLSGTSLSGTSLSGTSLSGTSFSATGAYESATVAAGRTTAVRAGHGCRLRVRASWNPVTNRFAYSGNAGCSRTRVMKIWCFPVHRHRFSWHSHTTNIIQNGPARRSALNAGRAVKAGTNGDQYKINCKLELDGRSSRRVVVESAQFNL